MIVFGQPRMSLSRPSCAGYDYGILLTTMSQNKQAGAIGTTWFMFLNTPGWGVLSSSHHSRLTWFGWWKKGCVLGLTLSFFFSLRTCWLSLPTFPGKRESPIASLTFEAPKWSFAGRQHGGSRRTVMRVCVPNALSKRKSKGIHGTEWDMGLGSGPRFLFGGDFRRSPPVFLFFRVHRVSSAPALVFPTFTAKRDTEPQTPHVRHLAFSLFLSMIWTDGSSFVQSASWNS